jgi:hypothetical protein
VVPAAAAAAPTPAGAAKIPQAALSPAAISTTVSEPVAKL